MSTHNICFHGEIKKKYDFFFVKKSALSGAMLFEYILRVNMITVFTLSTRTPYLLTILVLKFEIVHSTTF